MSTDRLDNPVGTGSVSALAAFDDACERLCSFYGTPLEDLERATQEDPGWSMPWAVQAGFLLSLTEHRVRPQALQALQRATELSAHAPSRERAHVAAVRALSEGHWDQACAIWDRVLLLHPRDIVALQLAHLFDFYQGDALNLRHRVARVLPEWPATDPLRPYVLGMYAFGLEECQLYAQAEDTGRAALAHGVRVPWAVHAVAHVMEMQGRHSDGGRWLDEQRAVWATDDNGLAGHNAWHRGLFHLEALDTPAALRVYDEMVASTVPAEVTLQRLDATALLWRLHLLHVRDGGRWAPLADAWLADEAAWGDYAFNDWHAMIALVGAGRLSDAERCLARATARASAPETSALHRAMARDVGLPAMRGWLALGQGRHAQAASELYAVRTHAHRFGGSHAQRDLIDQTLLSCAVRGGLGVIGRALLNERRLAKRETPLTQYWLGACRQRRR